MRKGLENLLDPERGFFVVRGKAWIVRVVAEDMNRPAKIVFGLVVLILGASALDTCLTNRLLDASNRLLASADLSAIAQALENFAADHDGAYPADLGPLFEQGDGQPCYLKTAGPVTDPWKHPYIYEWNAASRHWRLTCYGSDGKPGGKGDARDLSVESK